MFSEITFPWIQGDVLIVAKCNVNEKTEETPQEEVQY